MRKTIVLALVLTACLAPVSSHAGRPGVLAYEVGRILIERSGPLDPVPSEPCASEASTADDAGLCVTAPGCLVSPDPLLSAAYPEGPPCRLAVTFTLSGHIERASGAATLEMLGEVSSASGLVLSENINLLYGGPFDIEVAPDGSFTATVGPIEWQTWGAGPTCSHFSLYWVNVHDPNDPLGVPPDDPGPGADVDRCV